MIEPALVPGPADGVRPDDPYVRRFWVATIGPVAVADLLRLIAAAHREVAVRRPIQLSTLLAEGLAWSVSGRIVVPSTVPRIGSQTRHRLPVALRRELAALDQGRPAFPVP